MSADAPAATGPGVALGPRRVVLGVAGGIAAYKAAALLRLLRADGHDVTVVPTEAALRFVGEPTWAALSGRPVASHVWADVHEVPHVRLGREAELVVVAPATADLLARAAHGLADDLLTNVLLTATCPVVLAPAMHTEMWLHPATRANVATLRARGSHVLEPAVGRLTGSDSGPGRLPEPEEIHEAVGKVLAGRVPPLAVPPADPDRRAADRSAPAARATWAEGPGDGGAEGDRPAIGGSPASGGGPVSGDGPARLLGQLPRQDLAGRHVVVSAGGTREPLDPVRFLGNASSGRQGIALAEAARDRGARVTLVAAHVDVPLPHGVQVVRAGTADELHRAVHAALRPATGRVDALVMAAAVADFRPVEPSATKLKKSAAGGEAGPGAAPGPAAGDGLVLSLVRTVDVLATESAERPHPRLVVVGFAAETGDEHGDVLDHARAKLRAKGCDLLVVNDVAGGAVFGAERNAVVLLGWGEPGPDGLPEVTVRAAVPDGTKREVADAVWDVVLDVMRVARPT